MPLDQRVERLHVIVGNITSISRYELGDRPAGRHQAECRIHKANEGVPRMLRLVLLAMPPQLGLFLPLQVVYEMFARGHYDRVPPVANRAERFIAPYDTLFARMAQISEPTERGQIRAGDGRDGLQGRQVDTAIEGEADVEAGPIDRLVHVPH